jgi:hypothetical protein
LVTSDLESGLVTFRPPRTPIDFKLSAKELRENRGVFGLSEVAARSSVRAVGQSGGFDGFDGHDRYDWYVGYDKSEERAGACQLLLVSRTKNVGQECRFQGRVVRVVPVVPVVRLPRVTLI